MIIPVENTILPNLQVKRYKRLGDLVGNFMGKKKYSKFVFYDPDKRSFFNRRQSKIDFISNVKETGYWGFCEPSLELISVWIDPKIFARERDAITYFIAHELTHAFFTYIMDPMSHIESSDDLLYWEEGLCNTVGEISVLSWRVYGILKKHK